MRLPIWIFVLGLAMAPVAWAQDAGDAGPAAQAAEAEAASADASADGTAAEEPVADAQEQPGAAPEPVEDAAPAVAETEPVPDPARRTARKAEPVQLGPMGHDAQGTPGRVHTVRSGQTLWDISDAYLATPWVWPSVWRANSEIANPHRIFPGDLLWISAGEMRKVSDAEAAALLAREGVPAAIEDASAVPAPSVPDLQFNAIEATGVVSKDMLAAATQILESPRESIWLAEMDAISIGFGRDQTSVGDQFTIFRLGSKAYDPERRGRVFGNYVEILGWAEVTSVDEETATLEIKRSYHEVMRGDRVIPRQAPVPAVDFVPAPPGLAGNLLHFPDKRYMLGGMDVVYLNRGVEHGVEVGNRFEIVRPGERERDRVRGKKLMTPDRVVGDMVVVKVDTETSVAVVMRTATEVAWGDQFRTPSE